MIGIINHPVEGWHHQLLFQFSADDLTYSNIVIVEPFFLLKWKLFVVIHVHHI